MKWTPPWAPHVEGEFDPKAELPMWVKVHCAICGDDSKVSCSQGTPRTQVARYARVHMHGEEMKKWDSK